MRRDDAIKHVIAMRYTDIHYATYDEGGGRPARLPAPTTTPTLHTLTLLHAYVTVSIERNTTA